MDPRGLRCTRPPGRKEVEPRSATLLPSSLQRSVSVVAVAMGSAPSGHLPGCKLFLLPRAQKEAGLREGVLGASTWKPASHSRVEKARDQDAPLKQNLVRLPETPARLAPPGLPHGLAQMLLAWGGKASSHPGVTGCGCHRPGGTLEAPLLPRPLACSPSCHLSSTENTCRLQSVWAPWRWRLPQASCSTLGTGWDRTGWDGTGRDGTGWDGT